MARLRGRKRRLPAARRPPHVGPARRDAGPDAHGRELETPLHRGRPRLSLGRPPQSVLLSNACRHLHGQRPHHVRARAQTAFPWPSSHPHLGRPGWPQEPSHARLSATPATVAHRRAPAGLCAGTEPDRTSLGQRQDARTRQRVRAGSRHAPCAAASGLCARPVSTTPGLRVPAPRGVALLTWSLIYSARFISGVGRARTRTFGDTWSGGGGWWTTKDLLRTRTNRRTQPTTCPLVRNARRNPVCVQREMPGAGHR